MRLLLDTHILIWAYAHPARLSDDARELINSADNSLFFSVASLWEIAIKESLGRSDFQIDAAHLRRELLAHGYMELTITGQHVLGVRTLPPIHKDPFDRLLLAQAAAEKLTLLTRDATMARYSGDIRYT